jgi:hypothetical protein
MQAVDEGRDVHPEAYRCAGAGCPAARSAAIVAA